jgi:hypothetical protein
MKRSATLIGWGGATRRSKARSMFVADALLLDHDPETATLYLAPRVASTGGTHYGFAAMPATVPLLRRMATEMTALADRVEAAGAVMPDTRECQDQAFVIACSMNGVAWAGLYVFRTQDDQIAAARTCSRIGITYVQMHLNTDVDVAAALALSGGWNTVAWFSNACERAQF